MGCGDRKSLVHLFTNYSSLFRAEREREREEIESGQNNNNNNHDSLTPPTFSSLCSVESCDRKLSHLCCPSIKRDAHLSAEPLLLPLDEFLLEYGESHDIHVLPIQVRLPESFSVHFSRIFRGLHFSFILPLAAEQHDLDSL